MRHIVFYEPQSNRSINHVKRQYSKSDLASLVEDTATNPCESSVSVDEACRPPVGRKRHASQQRMSLTSKDVLQLLYPDPQVDERVSSHEVRSFSRSDDGDDVEEQSCSQQVLDHILQQTMSELGREVRNVTCTYLLYMSGDCEPIPFEQVIVAVKCVR